MNDLDRPVPVKTIVVVTVFAILLFLALWVPPYRIPRAKVLEGEVKGNLHNIQLALEKYAVDHDGVYPAYLVGGEACWSAEVNLDSSANAFSGQFDCPDLKQAADPLLRAGYIDAYPATRSRAMGATCTNSSLRYCWTAPAATRCATARTRDGSTVRALVPIA